MNQALSSLAYGVVSASVLVLASVGFTLQFSVTNILNLAVGGLMTLSAFVAMEVNHTGLNIWLALVVAGLFGSVASWGLNRLLYRPFIRKGTTFFGMVVVTIAVGLMIEYGIQAIWGPNFFHYNMSTGSPVHLGSVVLSSTEVVIVAIGVATMVGVHLLLRHTRLGRAMRATAGNPELAKGCGVPTDQVIDIAWLVSGALVGMAGVTLALGVASLSATLGDTFLLEVIAAAILGGIGQPYGAMLGALVIGIVVEESSLVISASYSEVAAFGILILVLLLRPAGILAGGAKEKVIVG